MLQTHTPSLPSLLLLVPTHPYLRLRVQLCQQSERANVHIRWSSPCLRWGSSTGKGQSGRGAKLNRICMAAHTDRTPVPFRPPPKNVVVASCCCCCSVPALNWICLMTSCCFLGKQCHSNGRVLSAITVCLTVWQLKVTTISYRYFPQPPAHQPSLPIPFPSLISSLGFSMYSK